MSCLNRLFPRLSTGRTVSTSSTSDVIADDANNNNAPDDNNNNNNNNDDDAVEVAVGADAAAIAAAPDGNIDIDGIDNIIVAEQPVAEADADTIRRPEYHGIEEMPAPHLQPEDGNDLENIERNDDDVLFMANNNGAADVAAAVLPVPVAASSSNFTYDPASPNDRTMALEAVARNSRLAWTKLPEPWQRDKAFILMALNKHGNPLPSKSDFERKFPQPLRFDRDVVLAFCRRPDFETLYQERLLFVPDCLNGDKEVMMAYCRRIPRSLQECSEELCNDRDVVEAAISLNGVELQYASLLLQQDKALIRKACVTYGRALELCPRNSVTRQELIYDRDFIVNVVLAGPGGGAMLKLVPPDLQDDPEVVLQALKHGLPLREVPQQFWTVDFLRDAIQGDPQVYLQLNKHRSWQQSPTLALEAILSRKSTPEIHERALGGDGCPHLRTDRQVVLAICQRGSVDFMMDLLEQSTPSLFRDDLEVMKTAIRRQPTLYHTASSRLQLLPEIILVSITRETACSILETIPPSIQQEHPEIIIRVIRLCPLTSLPDLTTRIRDEVWQGNRDICIAWMRRTGRVLPAFEPQLKTDEALALQVARYCWKDFYMVGDELLRDRDFVIRALQLNGQVLLFVPEPLRCDFDVLLVAVANHFASQDRVDWHGDTNGIPGDDNTNNNDHNNNDVDEDRRHRPQQQPQPLQPLLVTPLPEFVNIPDLQAKIKSLLDLHATFLLQFLRGIAISPCEASSATAAAAVAASGTTTTTATATRVADTKWIERSNQEQDCQSAPVIRRSKVPKLGHSHDSSRDCTSGNIISFGIGVSSGVGSDSTTTAPSNPTEVGNSANIDADDEEAIPDNNNNNYHQGCSLTMLNCGVETSEALKRLIAEYSGVPVGTRLTLLRRAHDNLQRLPSGIPAGRGVRRPDPLPTAVAMDFHAAVDDVLLRRIAFAVPGNPLPDIHPPLGRPAGGVARRRPRGRRYYRNDLGDDNNNVNNNGGNANDAIARLRAPAPPRWNRDDAGDDNNNGGNANDAIARLRAPAPPRWNRDDAGDDNNNGGNANDAIARLRAPGPPRWNRNDAGDDDNNNNNGGNANDAIARLRARAPPRWNRNDAGDDNNNNGGNANDAVARLRFVNDYFARREDENFRRAHPRLNWNDANAFPRLRDNVSERDRRVYGVYGRPGVDRERHGRPQEERHMEQIRRLMAPAVQPADRIVPIVPNDDLSDASIAMPLNNRGTAHDGTVPSVPQLPLVHGQQQEPILQVSRPAAAAAADPSAAIMPDPFPHMDLESSDESDAFDFDMTMDF